MEEHKIVRTVVLSPNPICSFLYGQILEQCLARGRHLSTFQSVAYDRRWNTRPMNERITFYSYSSMALSFIIISSFRLVMGVNITQVFEGFTTCLNTILKETFSSKLVMTTYQNL